MEIDVPAGLKGVVVADTAIGDVRGEEGRYHYRGSDATALARAHRLEDVWQLVLDGALPDGDAARRAFDDETRSSARVPDSLLEVLPAVAAAAPPMDGLRTALSLYAAEAGMRPLLDLDAAARRRDALALCAVTPVLLGTLHRLRAGLSPVPSRPELGYAANYVWCQRGEMPSSLVARSVEQYLISTIDHGFNASTFTARVVASTGADLGAVVVAALGALSGPLHGGAPSRALALLDEVRALTGGGTSGDGGPGDLGVGVGVGDVGVGDVRGAVEALVRPRIDAGEKVMGFGHAVYRTVDPRAVLLREVAARLAAADPSGRAAAFVALAAATEEAVLEQLRAAKPGRSISTNVEYYAGVVMELCGIAREMFTPTFAASRVIGWCAHALEQADGGGLIRPSARYVGPLEPGPFPAGAATAAA